MENGMRNSNCMAIAPTATISNICGVSQSIEPTYSNLFVKANMSGEFTWINPYLIRDLKKLGMWNGMVVDQLKRTNGSVQTLDLPDAIKNLYKTAFEIAPEYLVECTSRRQKWLDQSQSFNLYLAGTSGKKLSNVIIRAWQLGVKTLYYLRSMGATRTEPATLKGASRLQSLANTVAESSLNDECEACQ
jgi:ribonucleoside-diphosphate reductase alpha chain